MKLGLVSAILDWMSFEEMIDTISSLGYECVEAACWPSGKAERRYAGVSHIDVDELSEAKAEYILNYCKEKNVEISSLAFYPNTMDSDLEKRAANIAHLKNVIRASAKLKINMVSTFIGRDQTLPTEDNLELVKQLWPDIIRLAETLNVRIAIENCPMLFGREQWPGGQNLMCTPQLWRAVFDVLPTPVTGLPVPERFATNIGGIPFCKEMYDTAHYDSSILVDTMHPSPLTYPLFSSNNLLS